jgi:trans-2,3-dihydro-3-hydroxyanthranilate isomerase
LPDSHARSTGGREYAYETVDVFTTQRFGGNPLAVVLNAEGLSTAEMQSLAAEFNYSETTFVLPPADPANTARVRIFHRTAEMPFAGHPNVGTAFVLASRGIGGDVLRFEEMAGLVEIEIARDADGRVTGATVQAPQPLTLGDEIPADEVARCVGLAPEDVVVSTHPPVVASVGVHFVIAEVTGAALTRAAPKLDEFQRVLDARSEFANRFSLHLYARGEGHLRARMFAPVAGTVEDPATGSANAALVPLLLSRSDAAEMEHEIVQGVEMGRPSRLHVRAWGTDAGIRSSVRGSCVHVARGFVTV